MPAVTCGVSRIVPRYNFRSLGAPIAFRALQNTCGPRNISLALCHWASPWHLWSWANRSISICARHFLRHSSPNCLLDDLEELQWVAHVPSLREQKGEERTKFVFKMRIGVFFYKTPSNLDFVFHAAWEVDLLHERGFSFKLIIRRIHLNLCQYKSDFRCSGMLCLFLVVWRKNFKHFPPCSYWGQWKKISISY